MKNFFLKNLDKVNFTLILIILVYILSNEFNLTQKSRINITQQEIASKATNSYVPKTVTMRELITKGYRSQYKIISVNGQNFDNSDEALTAARTHDLNKSDLKIVFKDDQNSTKTIVLSASE